MRTSTRWRWIAVAAALATATAATIVVRQFAFTDPPAAVGDIGDGVHADGGPLPAGLQATLKPDHVTTFHNVAQLSDVVDIGPSGTLAKPLTFTVPLHSAASAQTGIVVATAESDAGPWTLLKATLTADRRHAVFTTPHLSWFTVLGADVGELLSEFRKDVTDAFSGGAAAEAQLPQCANAATARTDGYDVATSQKDTVLWCLDATDGKHVLKVVNNRRYVLAIAHDGATVLNPGTFDVISKLTSGHSATIQPREEIDLAVDLQPGSQLVLQTSLDGPGLALAQLTFGVEALLEILTRFGAGADKRAVDVIKDLVDGPDCAKAVGAGGAEIVAKCLSPKELYDAIGPVGLLLGILTAAGTFVDFFRSEFNALFDQFNDRDRDTITVTRRALAPCTASALF